MARSLTTCALSANALSVREFLFAMPWLPSLTEADRRQVISETHSRMVPAGGWLAREGDPPTFWYGVIEGLLKLCRNEHDGRSLTFTGVSSGSWFGEGTVIKQAPRGYDVVALRDTLVACMPAAVFSHLLENNLEFNHYIIHLLNERCGQFIGRFAAHAMLNVDAQVAHALACLFNPWLYPRMEAHLKISQEEVAHLSGISRPRCNEALHRLKQAGLVRTEYGGIRIVDLEGLLRFQG